MRQAISSAAALLLMASAALAAGLPADPNCPRAENVIAVLQKQFPEVKLTHIEGLDALRFVDAFNSGSASTPWAADEVLIARNPKTPDHARIGFFKKGCLLALVPRSLSVVDILERLLRAGQDI
jgi:hypothetical protein